MKNVHPTIQSALNPFIHQWQKPHAKEGDIGKDCTLCGNPANHAIHSTGSEMLGDRLVAHKNGSCITITDMDSNKSITMTPMSLDSLIGFYKPVVVDDTMHVCHACDGTGFISS